MRRILLLLPLILLASCSHSRKAYAPLAYEKTEQSLVAYDVWPDDVRAHFSDYTNTIVAWVGVIKDTAAFNKQDTTAFNKLAPELMTATTTLDHHYFDWKEEHHSSASKYSISPRGEGAFQVDWELRRVTPTATTADADKYAGPGKLAVVYGVPERVTDNGTIILKYRYLRVIETEDFDVSTLSYGRQARSGL